MLLVGNVIFFYGKEEISNKVQYIHITLIEIHLNDIYASIIT